MGRVKAATLYVGIFAGIPLAAIIVLSFLPALSSIDPAAIGILIVFTIIIVALWIFVPYVTTISRKRSSARTRRRTIKRGVSPTVEAIEELGGEATKPKSRKARSQLPLFEESEKREPFVDVVEKSTQHPAAQPQVRRKAQNKARKRGTKKKTR